jgi:transcriptional regulator with XRE-family HTH domain
MPIVDELAIAVKRQRSLLGLSQERVAAMAGLSRATVNQLETGNLANLSLLNAERLANAVGLTLGVVGARPAKPASGSPSPLELAASKGDISYAGAIPPDVLRSAFLHGVVAPSFAPQLRAILEEAPLPVLTEAARQIEREEGVEARVVWQKMKALALALGCRREIWE